MRKQSFNDELPRFLYKGYPVNYMIPQYMPFDDQQRATQTLGEALNQGEIILFHGYAGSGKTTVLRRFADNHPSVLFFEDFDSYSPFTMMYEIGNRIGVTLTRYKADNKATLIKHLKRQKKVMLMFDEADSTDKHNYGKLNVLRKIYDVANIPIVICGCTIFFKYLFRSYGGEQHYAQLTTRALPCKLKGMFKEDAEQYMLTVSHQESIVFDKPAKKTLSSIATKEGRGGIRIFIKLISRCITLARGEYYRMEGHEISEDDLQFVECDSFDPDGKEFRVILPPTPERIVITGQMIDEESEHVYIGAKLSEAIDSQ